MGNSQSEFDEKLARQLSLHDGSANLKTFLAAADFSPQNLETPSETASVQNSDKKSGQEEGKTGITPDSQTKLDSETKGDDKNIKNSDVNNKNLVTETEETALKSTTQPKNDPKVPLVEEKNDISKVPPVEEKNDISKVPPVEEKNDISKVPPVEEKNDVSEGPPVDEKNALEKTTTTMAILENSPIDDALEKSKELKEDKSCVKTEIEKSDVVTKKLIPEKDAVDVQDEINAVKKTLKIDAKKKKSDLDSPERVSYWSSYSCCRRS